jgi:hypothetical protein
MFAGPFPACSTTSSVALLNFDPATLPGDLQPEEPGGTWVTDYSEIRGTWDDGAIAVTEAQAAVQENFPPAPCDPPIGGWPGNGVDWDTERSRLGDYLFDRPHEYAGYWFATTGADPIDMNYQVLVVNTILEVADVEPVLDELFDGNLCVVKVDFSSSQLRGLPLEINTAMEGANADFDDQRNRVVMHPLTPSQEALDLAEPYGGRVLVEPWILRESSTPH